MVYHNLTGLEHRYIRQRLDWERVREQRQIVLSDLSGVSVIDGQGELLHSRKRASHFLPVRNAPLVPLFIAIRDVSTELVDVIEERDSDVLG